MTDKLMVNPTRDDFIKYINEQLTQRGFSKDPDKESWSVEKDIQSPGRTVIINNQRRDMPGETHHAEYLVEVFGDGDLEDVATERVDPFVEIDFKMIMDGQDVSNWPIFCMFFDEQVVFNSLINKIFQL